MELLDEVETTLRRYVVLPSDEDYVAVTLWIVATHCLPAFDTAPRLVVRSARKRSGKTRLMEIVQLLAHDALLMSNVSDAVMYRIAGGEHPKTFLIDEADTVFGPAAGNSREQLRAIINGGYERGSHMLRMAGPHTSETSKFETFAMVALAGIGQMPDTIEDRAVVVVLKPRLEAETVEWLRRANHPPLEALRDRLAKWAAENVHSLQARDTDVPVQDRAADLWQPLITIADEAGGTWPDRARGSCVELTNRHKENDSDRSVPVRLLGDIKTVFDREAQPFLSSAKLCSLLEDLDEMWDDSNLGKTRLASLLREFEVRPKRNKDRKLRGYYRIDLADAFSRYLR